MSEPFTISGVVRETFRIAGLNFWGFFIVALVTVEVPIWSVRIMLASLAAELQQSAAAGGMSPASAALEGLGIVAALELVVTMGGVLLIGIVVRAALDDLAGRAASFGSCLRAGFVTLPGNTVLVILAGLCSFLGFMLLAVPGFILVFMWIVILPVHVAEGGSFLSCFGRSRQLTKGCRWRTLWLTLCYGVIVTGVGLLLDLAKGLAADGRVSGMVITIEVLSALLGAALAVLSTAGNMALYLRLRRAKEGTPTVELAA